jgi:tRNA threonylcarbamoyladenosine biosynthesis protein TsaB
VNKVMSAEPRLLLIDTCGETAGVALCFGKQVIGTEDLERGSASADIISAVRRLLEKAGWRLAELDAVGVVNGPGSFTGLRAGLATAKGLCEAVGLRLVAVSRLAVLADAASLKGGIAALDAGRGELYLRDVGTGREGLASDMHLSMGDERQLVVAEERIAERLAELRPELRPLHVVDALGLVLRWLDESGDDVAIVDTNLVDANYVREEGDLYRKVEGTEKGPLAGTR